MTVTNNGDDDARDRAHQLRRDRARAAGRRPGPPGVRQPVRRDRVARLVYARSPRRGARARRRSGRSGACTWWTTGRERVGSGDLRDRPRPLPRPRPHDAGIRSRWTRTAPLSGTTGAVLDPIFALRARVRLEPRPVGVGGVHHAGRHRRASGPSSWPTATTIRTPPSARSISPGPRRRSSCASWASRRRTPACSRSWPGISSTPTPRSAPRRRSCAGNRGSQPLLWAVGVSGDWPILLATIDSAEGLPTLRQLLAAHHYWRRRGMMVDLVVLNTAPAELPAGAATSGSSAAIHASHDGGHGRPAGRRVRPAARPARAGGAAHAARHRARAPRRATAARSAASWCSAPAPRTTW